MDDSCGDAGIDPPPGTSRLWQPPPQLPQCDPCHLAWYYGTVAISRELYWNIQEMAKRQYTPVDNTSAHR